MSSNYLWMMNDFTDYTDSRAHSIPDLAILTDLLRYVDKA